MRTLIALLLLVASPVTHQISFSLRGDRARGWPVKVRITLASEAHTEEMTIEAGDVQKPISVRVPPGSYRLTIVAAGHRTVERTLDVEKELSLPEIALPPIPAISGRVIARQKDLEIPLVGAQVTHGSKLLATTDEQGLFHAELPEEPAPDAVTIAHTGQAPRVVPLFENLAAETDLGTIELPRGVTLTVLLDRRDEPKPLKVSIVDKKTLATRDVKASEDEVAFEGIAPGDYQIVVKGDEPLESMSEKVEVKDVDLEKRVRIEPFRLDGRVLLGNESLRGGGSLEIAGSDRAWAAQVAIDEDGRFGGTMWQTGKVSGLLRTPVNPNAIMEISPELGSDPSPWTIALKRRFIEGHVIDRATKEPVPRAVLELQVTSGERRLNSTVNVQKDGAYSILAMQNGRYELRVTSPDHADARKTVMVSEQSEGQILDFVLDGGVEAEVWFVWPDNLPVRGAAVMGGDGIARTDPAGRVVLHLYPGESRTVFAVPREGSFAFAELAAPRAGTAKPVQVSVPRAVGSLRIATFDQKRKPAVRPVTISYNGRQLPSAVLQRLRSEAAGENVIRLVHLPAGIYEIWMMGARPARVSLNGGEEAVNLVAIR
ncbi:MAG: carboxypeptidase-like regulatory domain-containing protein [Acidobacteriota bacterium]